MKGVKPEALERIEFYVQDVQSLRDAGFDVTYVWRVRDLFRADLIYVWFWTWALIPVLYAKLVGRPVLVTGVLDINYYEERPRWHQMLMRWAFALADMNVFTSRMEYDDLPARFPVRNPIYATLTVDTVEYRPGEVREENLVCTVGWLQQPNATRKCLAEVIRAAALVHETHPDVRFVMAGKRGNWAADAVALISEVGAETYIELTGAISREAKIALMQRCAVYLQPSRYEGFGLAILEAMSCGAPVLTSPAGAVPEVVGDAALLVDGSQPALIAAELRRYLGDPALRARMSERARTRAATQFPYARRRREIGALVEQLLA